MVPDDKVLKEPSPFNPQVMLSGCPQCKQAEMLHLICDEQDCVKMTQSGFQTPSGYRHTCADHYQFS